MRNALTVAQDLLAVWTDRDELDMVEFQDIIARRADLLAELACWDLWSLPERERNKVFELLNDVRTRDAALIEGFNSNASLTREKTIMNGDKCCTFRYSFHEK